MNAMTTLPLAITVFHN